LLSQRQPTMSRTDLWVSGSIALILPSDGENSIMTAPYSSRRTRPLGVSHTNERKPAERSTDDRVGKNSRGVSPSSETTGCLNRSNRFNAAEACASADFKSPPTRVGIVERSFLLEASSLRVRGPASGIHAHGARVVADRALVFTSAMPAMAPARSKNSSSESLSASPTKDATVGVPILDGNRV
jgi:hypothetical protein